MGHSEDVERLFSWLKAPMVHYREFAPQTELAEAAATWPLVHKMAVESGMAAEQLAPLGNVAAKAHRARVTMPAATQVRRVSPTSEAVVPQSDNRSAAARNEPIELGIIGFEESSQQRDPSTSERGTLFGGK